jgi:hypothetical protein
MERILATNSCVPYGWTITSSAPNSSRSAVSNSPARLLVKIVGMRGSHRLTLPQSSTPVKQPRFDGQQVINTLSGDSRGHHSEPLIQQRSHDCSPVIEIAVNDENRMKRGVTKHG